MLPLLSNSSLKKQMYPLHYTVINHFIMSLCEIRNQLDRRRILNAFRCDIKGTHTHTHRLNMESNNVFQAQLVPVLFLKHTVKHQMHQSAIFLKGSMKQKIKLPSLWHVSALSHQLLERSTIAGFNLSVGGTCACSG